MNLFGLCSFLPLLMLGACAPLIMMRALRGWSLTTCDKVEIPKTTSNVEDLFLLSLVVASCFAFGRLELRLARRAYRCRRFLFNQRGLSLPW
jgi:hypothetical protein